MQRLFKSSVWIYIFSDPLASQIQGFNLNKISLIRSGSCKSYSIYSLLVSPPTLFQWQNSPFFSMMCTQFDFATSLYAYSVTFSIFVFKWVILLFFYSVVLKALDTYRVSIFNKQFSICLIVFYENIKYNGMNIFSARMIIARCVIYADSDIINNLSKIANIYSTSISFQQLMDLNLK